LIGIVVLSSLQVLSHRGTYLILFGKDPAAFPRLNRVRIWSALRIECLFLQVLQAYNDKTKTKTSQTNHS
jgi:hypothetical protein